MAELDIRYDRLPEDAAGERLDAVLARHFDDLSREQVKQAIRAGRVRLDGEPVTKPNYRVLGGEALELALERAEQVEALPEPMDLPIVHEDEHVLVIDKPAGLVVHPGAGNPGGTLLNGLLHHDPGLQQLPRAGIVHRLDKDTTGLLVVARSQKAYQSLVQQLADRTVERVYEAIVQGEPISGGTIEKNIGRHPKDRKRMAALDVGGKPAVTHFSVVERFRGFAHVRVKLETGRTHQIRVHMAMIGHPLLGDPVYGGRRLKIPRGMAPEFIEALRAFSRQALHAGRLSFIHPGTGRPVSFSATLPEDMAGMIDLLRDEKMVWEAEQETDDWAFDDEVEVAWVADDGQLLEWD